MFFSVIIAVRNEKKVIKQCVEHIFSQEINEEFEVFIIDGMSDDGTFELLQKLNEKFNFTLLRNKKINAAAGRNIGIKKAKGKYIAFIDGDAIPSKKWLQNIKNVFEAHDETIAGVGGPDLLPKDSSEKEECIGLVMTSPLARGGKLNPSTQHSLSKEEQSVGHIPTCNLCIRKTVLDEVNGFDEAFVKGQDLELNHRIKKAGYALLYSPKITVVHYRKDSFRRFINQIFKWSKAKIAIIKKHGMEGFVSHVYIWPVYAIIAVLIGLGFFWSINSLSLFSMLFFFGVISYFSVIASEATRLSIVNKKKRLFWYSIVLIPVVHLTYAFGVWTALIKKNIW